MMVYEEAVSPQRVVEATKGKIKSRLPGKHAIQILITMTLLICVLTLALPAGAQSSLPFQVSNPRHLKWSQEEATRIYSSACELVARSIRPEKPPRLHPDFVLVLGADADETVRIGPTSEVRLKTWSAEHFAEAVVLMATREILQREDVSYLTRETLIAASASVSVDELKRQK
jgi:hypothetical protein